MLIPAHTSCTVKLEPVAYEQANLAWVISQGSSCCNLPLHACRAPTCYCMPSRLLSALSIQIMWLCIAQPPKPHCLQHSCSILSLGKPFVPCAAVPAPLKQPMTFQNVVGWETLGASKTNPKQAEAAIHLIQGLIKANEVGHTFLGTLVLHFCLMRQMFQ